MSISSQLQSLKTSVTNVFDINVKNKKSLIYEDISSVGRAELYQNCYKAYMKLCKLQSKFLQFKNLYAEETIDLVPQLLKEDQLNDIKKQIKLFLCLITPYLETVFVVTAIEWLVYKYEINLHQPEDILMSCIPFHNHKIFIKFARLLDLKKSKEFKWLKDITKNGNSISALDLSSLCLKYPDALEMISSWPIKVVEATDSDKDACKELCHVIVCLGINIRDKVKLLGSEKIEKYISPFTRLIIDGLNTTHDNLNSASIILLIYFSEIIPLDRKFLFLAIKKILKNGTINLFCGLRAIIDICNFQELSLKPKLQALFTASVSKLAEKERLFIEQLVAENSEAKEELSMPTATLVEVDTEMKQKPTHKIKTEKQVVKGVTKSVSIDWAGVDIESELIELLKRFVVNWVEDEQNAAREQQYNQTKVAIGILKLVKRNIQNPQIDYKPGGLIAHLCLAFLHPSDEVKKLVLELIKLFSNNWPNYKEFRSLSSNTIDSNPDRLVYGPIARLVLEEIDALIDVPESASATVSVACLSIINQSNIAMLPTLANVWPMFLSKLKPNRSYICRDAMKQSLTNSRSCFDCLSVSCRLEIIDSIAGGCEHDRELVECATQYLCLVPVSLDDMRHLLRNTGARIEATKKRNSMKKFKEAPSLATNFFTAATQDRFTIALSAFARNTAIPAAEQVMLIEPIATILGRIVAHLTQNKLNSGETQTPCSDENMVELVTNIMQAMLAIFTAVNQSPEPINLESVSKKIRLEVFSKCLYLFPNIGLNELNLLVIQNIVKMGLGIEEFSVIYFISWIGNHLVPREDQNSLRILASIIDETLPLCIKQKRDNSCDKVQIIIKFINESINLPKHRVLLFFKSIVKSLSAGDNGADNVLWIQLVFMAAIKLQQTNDKSANDDLIRPLLTKFPIESRIFALKAILSFLSRLIHDPSRKRKFLVDSADCQAMLEAQSPKCKKRKVAGTSVDTHDDKPVANDSEADFLIVKENLLTIDKNISTVNLFRTMLNHCSIHISESSDQLLSAAPEVLKEFIGSIFVSMKLIGRSKILPAEDQSDFCQSLRRLVECVGSSLPRNSYLSMIADLAVNDSDAAVKSKCIELLSNKLSTIVTSKHFIRTDDNDEIRDVALSILPMTTDIITRKPESLDWNSSLFCIANLVALGFTKDPVIHKSCEKIFQHLLSNIDFANVSTPVDKIVMVNIFLKNYIDSDCYEELATVFKAAITVIDKCVTGAELNSGQLESALALMHAIISRVDCNRTVDWVMLSKLLEVIFQLVSVDCKLRLLSRQSCDYQKQIRIKLSHMTDTKSVVRVCAQLTESGITNRSLTFISGSISLFGCHLSHLNRIAVKYSPDEEEIEAVWTLVCLSLSFGERLESAEDIGSDRINNILEISLKAINQLCQLLDFDNDIMKRLFAFTQQPNLSVSSYLMRNSVFFKIIEHLIGKSDNNVRVIEFFNNSDCVACASAFFKQLSAEVQSKAKRRKAVHQSAFEIAFSGDRLLADCPDRCVTLIKSICDGLRALLNAENKRGMNMSISDETIGLIGNVCRNMLSIDQFTSGDEYRTLTVQHMIPLVVQIATNSSNDEALLTPLAMGLCKHFTELSDAVHLAVLMTLADLKRCLGNTFDMSIRDNVSSFLEDCKLHDDETIANLANDVASSYQ